MKEVFTEEEKEAIFEIAEDVVPIERIKGEIFRELFNTGIISEILACGHKFTSLTDYGFECYQAILEQEEAE